MEESPEAFSKGRGINSTWAVRLSEVKFSAQTAETREGLNWSF